MNAIRSAPFALAGTLLLVTPLLRAQDPYDTKIRETYDFHFGAGKLSAPGNAATDTNGFIPSSSFPKAEYCGRCHAEAYHQWRHSLHSNLFRTAFYRTSVNILRDTKGMEFTRHRDSCHSPIAVVSGALTKNSQVDREFDQDGLTCTTCHSIQRVQPTLGNGSYVMGVPAVMLNVDLFAIRKPKSDQVFGPLGSASFEISPNETIETMVVIQNKNIGHSLIPEVRDLYEAWLEFTVADSSGKEIYHSGFLNPGGAIDERAHSFTNRPVDSQGEFVDNHKVFTIRSVAYDNTIHSGRSALVRYRFRIPADAKGPLTFSARVNYRHLRQSYRNNIFGSDHPAYPIVELGARTRTFNLGKNLPGVQDPQDNPDWMRWNNLGIVYLDQLQFSDALAAFNQVIQLRPDYADGYINLALTHIQWEKYAQARPYLDKALTLSANNARALYYVGLVERRAGDCDAEIADFKKVVEQYPKSIDARRELGISYCQNHRYDEARAQFEALQAIEPDDLAAHYNLAVIYRRMGMKERSSEEAAMFATQQVDPGAPTYSLDFLRKHPEISIESSAWHVHEQLPLDGALAQSH